jgi:hypothetical protein
MKKILLPFMLVFMVGGAWAAERSAAKIQSVGVPACINVSSNTWTAIPSTTTARSGRGGMLVATPSSTVGAFNVVFTSYSVQSPSVATTVYSDILSANSVRDYEISQYVFMFAFSTHTLAATQPLCYQEYLLEKDR